MVSPPPLKKRLISVTDEVSREICKMSQKFFFVFIFILFFSFFLVFSSFSFLFSYIFPTRYTSCSGG